VIIRAYLEDREATEHPIIVQTTHHITAMTRSEAVEFGEALIEIASRRCELTAQTMNLGERDEIYAPLMGSTP
jgi:hypothetical protein